MLLSVCLCSIFLIRLGVDKTYKWLTENYYEITQLNVAWIVVYCNICVAAAAAAAKTKALVRQILSGRCLDCV
jgi:predicted transporter